MAGALVFSALFLPLARTAGPVPGCQEVRSAFQLLHPSGKWAPESPVSGAELQVCHSRGLTCCSRKMEEQYQVAARQRLESSLKASSSQLKLLIIQNAALFQEAFEMVLRHARNATLRMLGEEFPGLRGGANAAVGRLFLEASFYILGSDVRVDDVVASFFDRLFPVVYRRLLGGGGGAALEDCLHGAWRDTGAFGAHPKLLAARLSSSLLATRVFLQALNLGIEVVNTTAHLHPGRECSRSLARLWHCPHCQGLPAAPPCPVSCLAAVQDCLGGVAHVQPHWQRYVEGLSSLETAMRGEKDLEAVVMRLHAVLRLALRHAIASRGRLSAAVARACSHPPQRVSRSAAAPLGNVPAVPQGPQTLPFDPEETLAGRRREFISSLKTFRSFFTGLGEALCSQKAGMLNDSHCWDGLEMTERFPLAGSKRAQLNSPKSIPKAPEPVISQIIDKLKHINQLLHLVTAPQRRWRVKPGGGATQPGGRVHRDEEGLESGDCDDEDACGGMSGLGPPPRYRRLRIFADLADNLDLDDLAFTGQFLPPLDADGGGLAGAAPGLLGPPVLIVSILTLLWAH